MTVANVNGKPRLKQVEVLDRYENPSSNVATGDLPDAGTPVIEITSAMIAAGVSALPFLGSEIGSLSEETLVSRVYLAMREAMLDRP